MNDEERPVQRLISFITQQSAWTETLGMQGWGELRGVKSRSKVKASRYHACTSKGGKDLTDEARSRSWLSILIQAD